MGMIKIDIGIEMISTILYFSNHYKIGEVFMGGNHKPRMLMNILLEQFQFILLKNT